MFTILFIYKSTYTQYIYTLFNFINTPKVEESLPTTSESPNLVKKERKTSYFLIEEMPQTVSLVI